MTNQIASSNRKYYKKRNRLIGVAIFLTTLLLYLVPTLAYDIVQLQFAAVNEVYPTWHAIYHNLTEEKAEKISAYHDIADYGLRDDVGEIVSDKAKIYLMYLDENATQMYRIELESGRLPQKENEIALSRDSLNSLQISAQIGNTFTLPYQIMGESGLGYQKKQDFVLTGLLKGSQINSKNETYPALISKDFLQREVPTENLTYSFLFRLKADRSTYSTVMENKVNEIAEVMGISKNDIGINKEYIMANYIDPVYVPTVAVIMLIIILAGIITIYSIYYVALGDRIKEFGRLKAIGATKRQLRKIVLREGFETALYVIPISLLVGTLCVFLIFRAYGLLIHGDAMMQAIWKTIEKHQVSLYHWWSYVLAIVVSLSTVYLSLRKPMKIVANVSEIEAMRFTKTSLKKKRKSFSSMSIAKLSWIELLGQKKTTWVTIGSMSITGIFVIIISTVLSCANPKESASNDIYGNYEISLSMETGNKEHPEREWKNEIKNNPLTPELKEQILKIPGVEAVWENSSLRIHTDFMEEDDTNGIEGLSQEFADKLIDGIIDGTVTYDELKQGDKVILDSTYLMWYDIKVGDKIKVYILDGEQTKPREVTVAAIGSYSYGFNGNSLLIMAEEGTRKLCAQDVTERFRIFTKDSYNQEIDATLRKLISGNPILKIRTWEEYYEQWRTTMQTTSIACYIFLGILSIICIMNMINTMINSVHVRTKEIGMLQAMGMTDRQLKRMLQMEGLFYTIGTLLLSVGLGSLLGYPIYLFARKRELFSITTYHYPKEAVLLTVTGLVIIQMLLANILSRSAKKESIMERIRYSE